MNGAKIRAIIDKEIADARKNKMIIISMALLPTLLVAMVLGTAFFMLNAPDGQDQLDQGDMAIIPPQLQDLDPMHAFLVLMNDQFLFHLGAFGG